MNIIIKNSIDNITKCDIIFIEIKNVETKDGCHDTNSYYDMRLFNLNYSEPSAATDGSLFISIANVKHKCHYIYNGINNSTDTKK